MHYATRLNRRKLAENIDWYLLERNMSKSEFGRQVGISRSHVANLTSGRTEPSLGIALKIIKVLGISLETLLEGTEEL